MFCCYSVFCFVCFLLRLNLTVCPRMALNLSLVILQVCISMPDSGVLCLIFEVPSSNLSFFHFPYNHSVSIAFLEHLDFLEWPLTTNIPGRAFKYFLLWFPQAPITPAFNFSLKCAWHLGLMLFASFLTSPCTRVSIPSFWERLHLYLLNVRREMGDFNSLKYGNGKEFEKTERGIPGEGARFN